MPNGGQCSMLRMHLKQPGECILTVETFPAQVGKERLRDLIAMETVLNLNEAFCEHHRQKCVPANTRDGVKMMRQCDQVQVAAADLREEYHRVGSVRDGEDGALCVNAAGDDKCTRWASEGACNGNAGVHLIPLNSPCVCCKN